MTEPKLLYNYTGKMRNGKNLGWGGDRAQKENKEQIKNQHGTQKYGGKFQKNELKLLYVVASGERNEEEDFFYHSLYKL